MVSGKRSETHREQIMTATIHGYFVDKARRAFATAGGDPDLSGPLAEWAQDARAAGDGSVGVLVGEDGTILADTRHVSTRGIGASYVTAVRNPAHAGFRQGVLEFEIGLAAGALRRLTGAGVVHIRYSQVCQGAGTGR